MESVTLALIFAIICPFIWGLMNIIDKYVVSHRVKKPLSFAIIAGFFNLIIGIILSIFLDWSTINSLRQILFPTLAGMIFALQFYLYYYIISKEDVSKVIGFVYFYPVLIAILSYFLLNERLSWFAYIGIFLILSGAVFLSTNIKKIKKENILGLLIILMITVALNEFFIKLSTNDLPELNGLAISEIVIGITIMLGLFHTKTRKGVKQEIKHYKWAILTESLTFLGIFTLYFAMSGLSATIVSTIAATQPLFVFFMEKISELFGLRLSKDTRILPKIIPILLIVLGIIILYSF